MGDVAVKQFQIGLEGPFTAGAGSTYNGGTAVTARRRLAVEKGVDANWKPAWESPLEARGTYAGRYNTIFQMMEVAGKLPAHVYPDDMIVLAKMLISGTPVVTSLPTVPQPLLAATAIASTLPALTTQPNVVIDGATCKLLAITLANASNNVTPVTVTLTGTDVYANVLIEILSFTAGTATPSYTGGGAGALTVTLYTKNYFTTVTSISTSAQPVGDTVTVSGINAFLWIFKMDMAVSTLYSATAEYFDGTASWQLMGMIANKGTFTSQIGKSFKFDASFMAKNKSLLVATAASVNPAASAGDRNALTNLVDNVLAAIPTYRALFYADPIGAVPGTTSLNARLLDFKIDIDTGAKLGKAADGTPYATFVGRDYYGDKLTSEFVLLFNSYLGGTADPAEVAQFLNLASRVIRCAFPGVALPCGPLNTSGNWPLPLQINGFGGQYGTMFDIAGKYADVTEKDVDGRLAMQFKLASEVDIVSMGTPMTTTFVSRLHPNYY